MKKNSICIIMIFTLFFSTFFSTAVLANIYVNEPGKKITEEYSIANKRNVSDIMKKEDKDPNDAGGGSSTIVNNQCTPSIWSQLRKLPGYIVDELGGEAWTCQVKYNTGKSRSNLYWIPSTGDIYSVPNNGGEPEWVDSVSPRR